jgi:hypothetical protein
MLLFIHFCGTGVWTQGRQPWATAPALFWDGFFRDRVSRTIFPGWLWTSILPISASRVAGITGVSCSTRPSYNCFKIRLNFFLGSCKSPVVAIMNIALFCELDFKNVLVYLFQFMYRCNDSIKSYFSLGTDINVTWGREGNGRKNEYGGVKQAESTITKGRR